MTGDIKTLELISDQYIVKVTGVLDHIKDIELYVESPDQADYTYTVHLPGSDGKIELKVRKLNEDDKLSHLADTGDLVMPETPSVEVKTKMEE